MANFFDIDQMLGDPNQDTTLTFRAKPLQAGGEKNIQPIQKTGEAAGGGETGKSFGDVITSPAVRDVLANVAIGLDPQGVGGTLARGAKAQIESEQFAKVIAKMESGQEIEAADVIGLSPQAQQQAFNIIQAKGVAGRAERQLGLQEAAAPGQRELVGARTAQITGAGEQALSEIDAKGKVAKELERLKQAGDANWREDRQLFADRVDYGVINQKTGERRSIAVGEPSPRDLGIFDQGGRQGRAGADISGADLDLVGRQIIASKTFSKFLNAKQKILGIPAGKVLKDTPERQERLVRQLASKGLTAKEYMDATGQKDLSNEEIEEIAQINRFAKQNELFEQRMEFQPQLPSGAGTVVGETTTPSQVNAASQFMTNTITNMTTEQQDEYVNSIPPDVLQLIDVFLTNNKKALSSKNRAIVHAKNFSGRR